jgi:hypothetical protein
MSNADAHPAHPPLGTVADSSASRMRALQHALHAAQLAFSHEKSGDTAAASSCFASSATKLKSIADLSSLSDTQRQSLQKFILTYQQRAQQQSSSGSATSGAGGGSAAVDGMDSELRTLRIVPEGREPLEPSVVPFNPDTADGYPPKEVVARASWLARLLSSVLSEGGFVVPTVYVPSALWLRGCGAPPPPPPLSRLVV